MRRRNMPAESYQIRLLHSSHLEKSLRGMSPVSSSAPPMCTLSRTLESLMTQSDLRRGMQLPAVDLKALFGVEGVACRPVSESSESFSIRSAVTHSRLILCLSCHEAGM